MSTWGYVPDKQCVPMYICPDNTLLRAYSCKLNLVIISIIYRVGGQGMCFIKPILQPIHEDCINDNTSGLTQSQYIMTVPITIHQD